jgi:hypothetical protein
MELASCFIFLEVQVTAVALVLELVSACVPMELTSPVPEWSSSSLLAVESLAEAFIMKLFGTCK